MSIKIEGGGSRENVFSDSDSGMPLWNGAPLLNLVYPVGSIYWSSNNTNPSTLFGGTWTQIKDKFILAAGDSYTNGATGGASSVTLTVNNMPSHSHSFTPSGTVSSHTHTGPSHSHSFTPSGTVSKHSHSFTPSGTVESLFDGTAGTTGEMSGDTSGWWNMTGNKNGRGSGGRVSNYEYENSNGCSWYDHNPIRYTINLSHTHDFTPSGTVTSTFTGTEGTTSETTPSFTGTAGTTDAAGTGNTGATAPSFTGTAGTTGANGSGTAHNNMPPYIVKYCWERTA